MSYTKSDIEQILLRIKKEMAMHTVPESPSLITRSYLNRTIDFEINRLKSKQEIAE